MWRIVTFLCIIGIAFVALAQTPDGAQEEEGRGARSVILQGLNKVTARASAIEGPLGSVMHFGRLDIVVKSCWSAPPDKRPEHAALMEITENNPDTGPHRIFAGWMFASSPALNALEHPVYDITVIECVY